MFAGDARRLDEYHGGKVHNPFVEVGDPGELPKGGGDTQEGTRDAGERGRCLRCRLIVGEVAENMRLLVLAG